MAGKLTTTVRLGGAPTKGYTQVIKGSKNAAYDNVRNNAIYARNTQWKMGAEIAEILAADAVSRAERSERNEIRTMRSAIEKAANVEARRLMDFISSKLIGLPGARYGASLREGYFSQGMKRGPRWRPATPIGGVIEWAPLSRRWIHQKGNESFFRDTGQLKAQIQALRTSYPQSLGGIRVTIKEYNRARQRRNRAVLDNRRFALAELNIEIFPLARPNLFPGLLTGQWDRIDTRAALENSSLIPTSIRDKLSGPRRNGFPYRFRPMLGPATQFWMMHRIPAAISLAINTGTRLRDRSTL